jgi:hypothetical protein
MLNLLASSGWRAWATPAFFAALANLATVAALSAPATAPLNQPWPPSSRDKVVNISGVYPHLTVYNGSGECGIGALGSYAGKLWFFTYPPHFPEGSSDKLYAVDETLKMEQRPESVGGTHANRFLHRESRQFLLGPYLIKSDGTVRALDPRQLRARLTATMRHLTDPTNKVYYLGMERELFEVDVNTLAVKRLYGETGGPFPGDHGKGAYTSQGRLIVANNGERGWSLARDPLFHGPAGCLAESAGQDWQAPWSVVERKTFCEVTGPGGLSGNSPPEDRVWATGWDNRSVLLKLFEAGKWHAFRLPKGSYSHDALHGWYTEWPRIRELGSGTTMMHMHGLFYFFPKNFCAADTSGLHPISTFLKMPVDYCWWRGEIVMARDDASVMQNELAGQSHSSLWFGQFADLAQYGAPAGWGGPWLSDEVKAGQPSDPFLVSDFTNGVLHLVQGNPEAVSFRIQADAEGNGAWTNLATVSVPAKGYAWWLFPSPLKASWLRLMPAQSASNVTAYFHLGNPPTKAEPEFFQALAAIGTNGPTSDGLIKPAQGDARTLLFAANLAAHPTNRQSPSASAGLYQMDGALNLEPAGDPEKEKTLRTKFGVTKPDFSADAASVIVIEGTNRFRLPKGDPAYDQPFASGWPRGKREVVTERFLLNAHGTFYELPRDDAGGLRRIRPVTTHLKRITDFCSWRGLLVLAGTSLGATTNEHFFRSDDGKAGLWFGEVDDLWRLGPPRGLGGPWKESAVTAGVPSDPYLMTGYDKKTLELSHDANEPVSFAVEVDFLANGTWVEYARFTVAPGQKFQHLFPKGYAAHWIRFRVDHTTKATALLTYTASY